MKDLIYYMSVNDLKENSTLDNNIEDKILQRSIIDAQSIDIQNILGTDLYNAINTKIVAGTLTGVYKSLMDNYIFDCLLKYAIYRSLPYVADKLTNAGVIKHEGEYYKATKPTPLQIIALNDAEFYSNRLKDYLYWNDDDFPEYSTNTNEDIDPNITNSYFSGIQLDDDDTECWNWKYK